MNDFLDWAYRRNHAAEKAYSETEHPRKPKGHPQGGEFDEKAGAWDGAETQTALAHVDWSNTKDVARVMTLAANDGEKAVASMGRIWKGKWMLKVAADWAQAGTPLDEQWSVRAGPAGNVWIETSPNTYKGDSLFALTDNGWKYSKTDKTLTFPVQPKLVSGTPMANSVLLKETYAQKMLAVLGSLGFHAELRKSPMRTLSTKAYSETEHRRAPKGDPRGGRLSAHRAIRVPAMGAGDGG